MTLWWSKYFSVWYFYLKTQTNWLRRRQKESSLKCGLPNNRDSLLYERFVSISLFWHFTILQITILQVTILQVTILQVTILLVKILQVTIQRFANLQITILHITVYQFTTQCIAIHIRIYEIGTLPFPPDRESRMFYPSEIREFLFPLESGMKT